MQPQAREVLAVGWVRSRSVQEDGEAEVHPHSVRTEQGEARTQRERESLINHWNRVLGPIIL